MTNLRSFLLPVLAVVGTIGGAVMVYRLVGRRPSPETSADAEEAVGESESEIAQQEEVEENDQVENMSEERISRVIEDEYVITREGNMFLSLIGLTMMVVVLFVSLMVVAFDDSVSSPNQFQLFAPLMWVSLGIIAASITQAMDRQIVTSEGQALPPVIGTKTLNDEDEDEDLYRDQHTPASLPGNDSRGELDTNPEEDRKIAATPNGRCSNVDTIIKRAEDLYERMEHDQIRVYLKNCLAHNPNEVEILWRLARACNDLISFTFDMNEKKSLALEGLEYADSALKLNDNSAAAHKWVSIMTSTNGSSLPTKEKIRGAYNIRDHIKRAIELDPQDPTSHNILGRWCIAFADLSWMEKKLASALFGTPPSATYEEALEHFENAENISPGFWKANAYLLAETYYKMKRNEEAKNWLEKAESIPTKTKEDEEIQDKVIGLKARLG